MNENQKNDLFYICSLIELVARKTHSKVGDIVKALTDADIEHEIRSANVNHCLPLEQMADEWIEGYHIEKRTFDNLSNCQYNVPSATDIGKVYQRLIVDTIGDVSDNPSTEQIVKTMREVFTSFISEAISNFNSNVYYSSPEYLKESYKAGYLLD